MEESSMLTDITLTERQTQKAVGKRHAIRLKDKLLYKIIMGGGSNRGQSSFIKRYTTGLFESTTPTIGIDFALKHLELSDGRKLTLQLWDIGGQDRTKSMSQQYYQDAHACVLMFDVTYEKSLEICLAWKKDLDSKCTLDDGKPIPCMLLANKSDLEHKRKFTTEYIQEFAKKNGFIVAMETSVYKNTNVDEAMSYLINYLLDREGATSNQNQNNQSNNVLGSATNQHSTEKCC